MTKKKPIKIDMKDVHKAFGPKQVLCGLNLQVPEKESLVIIGGSGTGKSVSIKTVLGLLKPDAGSIKVDGEEVTNLSTRKRDELMHKFGMLFQGAALFDSMTVWQNISFALMQGKGKLSPADAKELAVEKLRQVGLKADVADLSPSELSGGMQKRVGLARAIAGDPEIIFFDEPTTGLDPIMADVINDLITKCREELGVTCMSITHDMASVRKIATRVAMLYDGKIIWEGPVKDIDKSGNEYVDQFVNGKAEGPISFV
ncbi:MAG: ATP-binding cassette domain-containing protein [Rickettsiales bacterium]|nr:ATP-binding cassette domain-containing protein [Rickettsiales bacterium]